MLRLVEDFEDLRHQRAQVRKAIAGRDEHDDCDIECRKVLLMREIAIGCDKHVELGSGKGEKLTIPLACPSHPRIGLCVMPDELAYQLPRQTLVKQNAHARAVPPWPALAQPRPVPW